MVCQINRLLNGVHANIRKFDLQSSLEAAKFLMKTSEQMLENGQCQLLNEGTDQIKLNLRETKEIRKEKPQLELKNMQWGKPCKNVKTKGRPKLTRKKRTNRQFYRKREKEKIDKSFLSISSSTDDDDNMSSTDEESNSKPKPAKSRKIGNLN